MADGDEVGELRPPVADGGPCRFGEVLSGVVAQAVKQAADVVLEEVVPGLRPDLFGREVVAEQVERQRVARDFGQLALSSRRDWTFTWRPETCTARPV